jgi:hypothetical protein
MASGSSKTLTHDQMNHLYYGINPRPHSEKAYQKGDPGPPIAADETIADAGGNLTVLVTSLHDKSEPAGVSSGAKASFKILTRASDGKWMDVFEGTGAVPFRCDVTGLVDRGHYWIQPLTPNTQAKILPTSLAPIS